MQVEDHKFDVPHDNGRPVIDDVQRFHLENPHATTSSLDVPSTTNEDHTGTGSGIDVVQDHHQVQAPDRDGRGVHIINVAEPNERAAPPADPEQQQLQREGSAMLTLQTRTREYMQHFSRREVGLSLFTLSFCIVLVLQRNFIVLALVVSLFFVSLFLRCLVFHCVRRLRERQRHGRAAARDRMEERALLRSMSRYGLSPAHLRLAFTERDFDPNDYEALLILDEELARQEFRGMPQSQIERFPSYIINKTSSEKRPKCAVCLEIPVTGDKMRTMICLHGFHANCIDRWLRTKPTCPVCNFDVRV